MQFCTDQGGRNVYATCYGTLLLNGIIENALPQRISSEFFTRTFLANGHLAGYSLTLVAFKDPAGTWSTLYSIMSALLLHPLYIHTPAWCAANRFGPLSHRRVRPRFEIENHRARALRRGHLLSTGKLPRRKIRTEHAVPENADWRVNFSNSRILFYFFLFFFKTFQAE